MKRFLLINSFVLALVGTSVVCAQASSEKANVAAHKSGQCRAHSGQILSVAQRTKLQQIKSAMRTQLTPLMKEKRALQLQIIGKMATPNAQWSEVVSLVDKNNANNAKIATLVARTRFETYQKLGILIPWGRHHSRHHHCNIAAK
jgi:uncharacterized membrane protein